MATRQNNTQPVSSEQKSLLAAIIQNPDEDTPRLMYADMLDEIGGESNCARAEFIRLQIQFVRAEPAEAPDRKANARAEKLLKYHRAEWEGNLRGQGVRFVWFRRGFAESVGATAEEFIHSGAVWTREHPLRRVVLDEVVGRLDRLVAASHLDSVRELSLRDDNFTNEHLFTLAFNRRPSGAGHYPNLEFLGLVCGIDERAVTSHGALALTDCELPRLRELYIADTDIDDLGAGAVSQAPWFGQLQTLTFETSRITDAGLQRLLSASQPNALSNLGLPWSEVTAEGLHALADMPGGHSLEALWLEQNPIQSVDPDRVDEALRKYPRLRLDLRECPLPLPVQRKLARRFGDRVSVGRRGT